MNEEISRGEFTTWLLTNHNKLFSRSNAVSCPLARFLQEKAPSCYVTSREVIDGAENHTPLPPWATDFVRKVDHSRSRKIRATTAIKILKGISGANSP